MFIFVSISSGKLFHSGSLFGLLFDRLFFDVSATSFVSTWAGDCQLRWFMLQIHGIPNRSSSSFMLRRLDVMFLLRSGYSHSCLKRLHVAQRGLTRSHFSFLFLQETHEIVFSRGFKLTAASPAAAYVVPDMDSFVLLDDAPATLSSGLEAKDMWCNWNSRARI